MIYVDSTGIPYKGKMRYHMTADSLLELHEFAENMGIKRCWFHKARTHPHYDVTEGQRNAAIVRGATAISTRELVTKAKSLVI